MRMRSMLGALVVTALLAGCSGSNTTTTTGAMTSVPLDEGKGGILGLLVNDIYRPVPGGLIFVEKHGFTATTNARGEFVFTGLDPGSYVLVANAAHHEASPINVDVVAGEYTEVEFQSRRIFNVNGTTITTQYSVFIPCATSTPGGSVTYGGILCPADLATEDFRPGLDSLDFSGEPDLTYLVAEVKTSQKDNYDFVVRHDDGSSGGGDEWGSFRMNMTDYGKVILEKNETAPYQAGKAPWKNANNTRMAILLFYMGQGGSEAHQAGCAAGPTLPTGQANPACREWFGAGQKFAIKGNIIITAFLGTPDVDVATYQVLGPSA
jgi:hypothetical protein